MPESDEGAAVQCTTRTGLLRVERRCIENVDTELQVNGFVGRETELQSFIREQDMARELGVKVLNAISDGREYGVKIAEPYRHDHLWFAEAFVWLLNVKLAEVGEIVHATGFAILGLTPSKLRELVHFGMPVRVNAPGEIMPREFYPRAWESYPVVFWERRK